MADLMGTPQRASTEPLAVALRDPLPWRDFEMLATTAEETGFDAVFLPEITGRDATAALAALAGHTSAIRLGTGVVPLTSRRLPLLAMAAATVHERSGGRLILGVGAGPPGPGSLQRVRDAVAFLREAFAGKVAAEPGTGEPFEPALVPDRPPPIWLAALGDRMVSLAGEVADGVLLNWTTPERVRRAAALVAESASRAGRGPGAVTVSTYIRACLGAEESSALDALRAATAQYAAMPHYRRQMESVGLGDAAARAADAAKAGRPGDVPEELVRELCLVGDPPSAARRLQEYRDAGAVLPVIYPVPALDPPSSIMASMLALAPHPALEP